MFWQSHVATSASVDQLLDKEVRVFLEHQYRVSRGREFVYTYRKPVKHNINR